GLAELEITEEELDRIFEEMAARFRKGEKKGVDPATASPRRPPSSGSGTPPEVSHDG
ncbi:TraC family protein, partial [Sinorhizobium meliloti]